MGENFAENFAEKFAENFAESGDFHVIFGAF